MSPTSGPTTGGTQITINGTNFATGATVRVGGTLATGVTLVSATQLRATTPAGTAGARDVQVTNAERRVGDAGGRLHLHGAVDGADADVGVADVGSDGGRHDDHADRHELRLGRDGARRRDGGDQRGVRRARRS